MAKTLRMRQNEIYENAVEKGWWDGVSPEEKVKLIPEKILLVHAELSEAVEEFRNGTIDTYIGAGGKPEGLWVEMADAVIRILDLAGAFGVDLEHVIEVKHEYNKTRSHRHGGKAI